MGISIGRLAFTKNVDSVATPISCFARRCFGQWVDMQWRLDGFIFGYYVICLLQRAMGADIVAALSTMIKVIMQIDTISAADIASYGWEFWIAILIFNFEFMIVLTRHVDINQVFIYFIDFSFEWDWLRNINPWRFVVASLHIMLIRRLSRALEEIAKLFESTRDWPMMIVLLFTFLKLLFQLMVFLSNHWDFVQELIWQKYKVRMQLLFKIG